MNSPQDNQAKQEPKKYWVIKIGSSVLGGSGLINQAFIDDLAEQIKVAKVRQQKIILVTSGAISQGMRALNIKKRPTSIAKLQALASIGQIKIVTAIDDAFNRHQINTAQILLTAQDLSDRKRYVNAKNTLKSLIDQGVVPIVNENDTISSESIRFGDNDTLAALVANLVSAHYLLILTDQKGLYDKNPSKFADAKLIETISSNSDTINKIEGLDDKSPLGSGGMKTKINAVKTAAQSGTDSIIASGFEKGLLAAIFNHPQSKGTFFHASISREKARKLWLGYALQPMGKIRVNQRAAKALLDSASLLAVGIVGLEGNFSKGDLVVISWDKESDELNNSDSVEIARGISNYSSFEIEQIKGLNTHQILEQFNFSEHEVVHRDNMLIAKAVSATNHL